MSPCCVASMLPRLTIVLNDMDPNLPVREFVRELLAPDATAGAPEPAIPFVQVQMPESAAAASEPPASAPASPASPDDDPSPASAPEDHRPPSYALAWPLPSIAVGENSRGADTPLSSPEPAESQDVLDVIAKATGTAIPADSPPSPTPPRPNLPPRPAGPPPFRPMKLPHTPAATVCRTTSQLGIHLPTQVAQPPPADPVSDAHSSPPVAMQNPPSLERVGPGPAPMDCDARDALNPHGFTVVPPSSQDEPPPTPCPEDAIITSSRDDEPDEPAAKKSRMREE